MRDTLRVAPGRYRVYRACSRFPKLSSSLFLPVSFFLPFAVHIASLSLSLSLSRGSSSDHAPPSSILSPSCRQCIRFVCIHTPSLDIPAQDTLSWPGVVLFTNARSARAVKTLRFPDARPFFSILPEAFGITFFPSGAPPPPPPPPRSFRSSRLGSNASCAFCVLPSLFRPRPHQGDRLTSNLPMRRKL